MRHGRRRRLIWRREDVQMSLDRDCVKDSDLQLCKTAGQGIAGDFGGAPVLTDSRSSDISTFGEAGFGAGEDQ